MLKLGWDLERIDDSLSRVNIMYRKHGRINSFSSFRSSIRYLFSGSFFHLHSRTCREALKGNLNGHSVANEGSYLVFH